MTDGPPIKGLVLEAAGLEPDGEEVVAVAVTVAEFAAAAAAAALAKAVCRRKC